MPIKLPKGFPRRKSSGTVLEEVENPPKPSFKVFERPSGGSRSFDGVNTMKRMSPVRPLSTPVDNFDDDLFADSKAPPLNNRGSGGTNNSASTGGLYDSSSSSARFSSSSTLPSSTDVPIHDDSTVSLRRALQDIPVPPIPESRPAFSIRAAGRRFSFGTKAPKTASPAAASRPSTEHNDSPASRNGTRERALTASTASTATPPKFLDSDVSFSDSDPNEFGNMFEPFNNRSSRLVDDQRFSIGTAGSPGPNSSSPAPTLPTNGYDRSNLIPSPINVDRSRDIESSPYSWGSHDSREGLMNSPSPTVTPQHQSPIILRKNLPPSKSMPISDTSNQNRSNQPGFGLRRSSAYAGRRGSTPVDDEDARLIMESVSNNRRTVRRSANESPSTGRNISPNVGAQKPQGALFDSEDPEIAGTSSSWRGDSSQATPRAKKVETLHNTAHPSLDTSFAAQARLAAKYEESSPSKSNKVMTPGQFERYRQQREQQELSRTKSNASKSDASDNGEDNYDDEDETERNRQAAKQRRKQEAHLTVYRQQMMKVTGEQPSDLPSLAQPRPSIERATMSAPNLPSRLSAINVGAPILNDSGKSSDDEEDEDVPLGILAAHGFPNKNKPPIRLSTTNSSSNLRGLGSVSGESTAQKASLPVFARNLPQDPYYGAGLVNPSNRESLAMGGGNSVHGGPPPGLPAGGLVGVIAGEERARAMRRGSPNAQGGYDAPGGMPPHPGMMRSQTMGNMAGMNPMMPGMPGMPPVLSPGDQAQIQMSQQMTQMMHMQMQWMQQMMQMQGMQNGQSPQGPQPPPTMPNSFLAPPGQMSRPFSMPSNPTPSVPGSTRQDQRTLSLLDPTMSQWNRSSTFAPSVRGPAGGQGYTASIAPSERSNIGLAPRYRPVSTVPDPVYKRASTFTSGSFHPWNDQHSKQSSSATIRPIDTKTGKAGSDDDDDEAWAEMKKKRDKKKSTWKSKKGSNGLHDLFNAAGM